MKKRTGIIGVLIAILALGIGYAAVTAVTLVITGTGSITATQENFLIWQLAMPCHDRTKMSSMLLYPFCT